MNDILTDLYYFLKPQLQTEGEKMILEKNEDIIKRIERQLSEKDISSFIEVQTELSMYREENAFSLGFQLAAQILASAWR